MRFVLIDRIVHSLPGQRIQGIKHVGMDDYYLAKDASGRYAYISSLVGEILGQLACWNVIQAMDFTKRPVAGIIDEVKFHRPAYLGETLFIDVEIDELDAEAVLYHGSIHVEDQLLLSIYGALGPLLPMNDLTDEAVAREQFKQIYHPTPNFSRQEVGFPMQSCMEPETLHCHPRMSFDWIQAFKARESLVAVKAVSHAAVYFADHFPNRPVLPMTVLLACQLNLADDFLKLSAYEKTYQVCSMRKIKMNRFIKPGDTVHCELKVKSQDASHLVLSFQTTVERKRVAVMELVMKVCDHD